jgi:OmpA-OmpF porin, OOP family
MKTRDNLSHNPLFDNYAVGIATMTLVAGLMGSSFAEAAETESGWTMGASVGQSKAKWDTDDISSYVLSSAITGDITDAEDTDVAFKVFAGYQFNSIFSLEGGYFDLGRSNFTVETFPLGTLSNEMSVVGFNIDAVASLPLTEMFSIFGRVGATYTEVKASFAGTGFVTVGDSSDTNKSENYKYGLGLQFNFSENFGMRLEAERYMLTNPQENDDDIEVASLGFVYRLSH